jgi:uncharacterized protein (TIGR02246 family)
MRAILGSWLVVSFVLGACASGTAAEGAHDGVASMLARSAAAWNHGDLDAFMETYENSPDTVYMGATSVIRGYAAIRAHYAAQYGHGKMGRLSVSDLAVRPLGSDYAVATARWHLARSAAAGGDASGLFSLVVRRTAAGWRIITDHTP